MAPRKKPRTARHYEPSVASSSRRAIPFPHIKKTPKTESDWFQALIDLARYLRSPDGCPWDRKQTTATFSAFAGEEAAELVDACKTGDNDEIEEEWGDTLFTLLAAAAAAEHEQRFTLLDALEKAHEKMIRRHAHIFGEHTAETPEDAMEVWKIIKAQEKEAKKAKATGPQHKQKKD